MPGMISKTSFEFAEAIQIAEFRQWAMAVGLGYDLARKGVLPMSEILLRELLPDDEYTERFILPHYNGRASDKIVESSLSFRRYHQEKVVELYHRWIELKNQKGDDVDDLI